MLFLDWADRTSCLISEKRTKINNLRRLQYCNNFRSRWK